MTCPACGTPQTPTARYCASCGFRLDGAIPQRPYSSSAATATSGGTQQPLAPNSVLQGRYRLERALGTGAFGRVYLAVDTQDDGDPAVAIKELLDSQFATPDEKREVITWFKREAGILLSLDHPSIPAIHGYWTAHRTSGPFYLAMDYIPGKTLDGVLHDAGGRVSWPQVVQWGIALCDVLGYLHGQNPPFIFRDMKLENVILDSRTGLPVLIDFGITRQLATTTGTAIGTWGYVPFEQVLGNAEPRSDLYALGATLHALLTGRHPDAEYTRLQRSGLNVESAMRALFPPANTLAPDIPPALAEALTKATAFDSTDRFTNTSEMSAALRETLAYLEGASAGRLAAQSTHSQPAPSAPMALPSSTANSPSTPSATSLALTGQDHSPTLEEAIRHSSPGATLRLSAGVHRLSQPLLIDKSLTLIGAGRESTRVVCDALGSVVRLDASVQLLVSDISFEHQGSQPANIFCMERGSIEFRRCGFRGAVRSEMVGGGVGLVFSGSTKGLVSDCDASNNALYGIMVNGQAQPTLEGNTCRSNGMVGIAYFDSAAGVAHDNTCVDNQAHGIYVGAQARPELQSNKCHSNQSGIVYFYSAGGTACDNTCTGNSRFGIYVADLARPVLQDNLCRSNEVGIAYFDCADGVVRGNTCTDNVASGIYIADMARPAIEGNNCCSNKIGVTYRGSARGIAHSNTCSNNGASGIYVGEQAQPTLQGNTCQSNRGDGVSIRNVSRPYLVDNTCKDNGDNGIYVVPTAFATGKGNVSKGNRGQQIKGQLHRKRR